MVAAAAGVQDPGRLVQQQRDVRPVVCSQGLSGSFQPPLAFVELTGPDQRAGEHYQCGRDHRFRAPAVPLGQGDRLAAAPLGRGERVCRTSDANPRCARQPTSRYGRPISRARSAPSRRWRSASGASEGSSDHASAVPRFPSAAARRSLPSAMSSSHAPVTGAARNLACSMTPARSPRRLASDSCSDVTATWRRRWRPAASSRRTSRRPRGGRPPRPGAPEQGHPSREPSPAQGGPRPAGRPVPASAWSALARRGSG